MKPRSAGHLHVSPLGAMAHLYILQNRGMPGLVKIGFTERQAPERAAELYSTGVPLPFRVVRSWLVANPRALEQMVHSALTDHRVNGNREFFRISADDAVLVIDKLLGTSDQDYSGPKQRAECSYLKCKNIGVILVAGRFFCPKCASRVRTAIRGAKCGFDRLGFLGRVLN